MDWECLNKTKHNLKIAILYPKISIKLKQEGNEFEIFWFYCNIIIKTQKSQWNIKNSFPSCYNSCLGVIQDANYCMFCIFWKWLLVLVFVSSLYVGMFPTWGCWSRVCDKAFIWKLSSCWAFNDSLSSSARTLFVKICFEFAWARHIVTYSRMWEPEPHTVCMIKHTNCSTSVHKLFVWFQASVYALCFWRPYQQFYLQTRSYFYK